MQNVKEDRWKYIGGSDIPIIMELVNYEKDRWKLLQEKARLWEDDFQGNQYTEYGNILEEPIREYVNWMFDSEFVEAKKIQGLFRYHADGFDKKKRSLLEVKTTGDSFQSVDKYKKYLVQLLFGMEKFDTPSGVLAVYTRPADMDINFDSSRLTVFPIDIANYQALCKEISEAVNEFVIDLNYLKENPDCKEQDLPSRKDLVPIATKVELLEQSISQYKQLEAEYKAMKEKLKAAMEANGVKTWTLESGTKFTLTPDGSDKIVPLFDEEAFKADEPKLYEKYVKEVTKKGRKGYVTITLAQ